MTDEERREAEIRSIMRMTGVIIDKKAEKKTEKKKTEKGEK